MATAQQLLAAARNLADRRTAQPPDSRELQQTAQQLVPVLQRIRIPLNSVAVRFADLAAAAESSGARIRQCGLERLAEHLASLDDQQREYVVAQLQQGQPAKVTDGETTTAFMLVSYPPPKVEARPQAPAAGPTGYGAVFAQARARASRNGRFAGWTGLQRTEE